ncbi:MAG: terpene synthase [Hassallia sp. WJT32-NPBG1]|jgi:5-epi-alpha-selinene synthase|nr:terpene synthase [Hassallia sp. WJT32-NPBG1]
MNQLVLPKLYCPFPSRINKYAEILEDYAFEWVLRFNLLANQSSYRRFCKSKFFMLAAGAYPYCDLECLKIANDLNNWLFIWDDQCDMSNLGKQPEVLKGFHNNFLDILNGAELTNQDIPLSHALSNLRQRMLQRGGAEWFHHFVCTLKDYFHGCVLQANYRAQGMVPSIETYIMIRNLCSGVDSCLVLIELCHQMMIPDFLRKHDTVKKLNVMTNNIISWCNDIFSADREIGSGDVHNLVFVLHYQEQVNLEKATKLAAKMHDQQVRKMSNLEASIPSFGEELDIKLAKYISGLHAWIRGNQDWYSYSGRYQTLEKLEIAKFSDY